MKVVYILLLSSICTLNAFANTVYQSFINDGKSWHYAKGNYTYCYKIKGDTIIDNQTFSKLYRQDAQYYGDAKWHYFAALKESDKKVYIQYPNMSEISLLYDFGMDKGDEYMLSDSTYICCDYKFAEEINGMSRNVYSTHPVRKDREENPTLLIRMVEGIGFEDNIDAFDAGTWMWSHPQLKRCYEDNILIYGNSDYTPLVREGVKWNCVMRRVNWYHPELSFNHHYSIQIKGDTIINEVQYKKCYYIFEDKDEPSNVISRAFLREDIENQQVFVLFNVDYKTEMGMYSLNYPEFGLLEEQMLYDFKNKKNTSPYWLMKYGSDWSIEVESLGMISLQNQVKEKYRLICFRNDYHYLSVELVEGIGLCLSTQKEGETFAGDLLTPYIDFYLGGDNTFPVFLNFEDAEGNIVYVAQEYNGIESVDSTHKDAVETTRYDLYGRRLSQPAQGVNIVKMSDGTTRKEMVK